MEHFLLLCVMGFIISFIISAFAGGTLLNMLRMIGGSLFLMLAIFLFCLFMWPYRTFAVIEVFQILGGMAATIGGLFWLGLALVIMVPCGVLLGLDGYSDNSLIPPLVNRLLLALTAVFAAWVWWSVAKVYFLPFNNYNGFKNFYAQGVWYHWKYAWAGWLAYWLMTLTDPRERAKRWRQLSFR